MKLLVATDTVGGIGRAGKIPWRCPEDVSFFKLLTSGETIIMGRNTFESISCVPLKDRMNIVITSNQSLINCASSNKKNLRFLNYDVVFNGAIFKDAWVIGGGKLYEAAMPYVDTIYKSIISGTYDCDVFFPKIPDSFRLVAVRSLSEDLTVEKWRHVSEL